MENNKHTDKTLLPEPDLGVLFVHGIGEQKQGETLALFGDTLIYWFRRWILGARRQIPPGLKYSVRDYNPVRILRFGGRYNADNAPWHVLVEIDTEIDKKHLLLSESWWAETFITPSFATLTRWSFIVVPWILISHTGQLALSTYFAIDRIIDKASSFFHSPEHSSKSKKFFSIYELARLVVFFVVLTPFALLSSITSVIIMCIVILLFLLALIPYDIIKKFVLRLQLLISAYLGDSYILLNSDVQESTIIEQVVRDLGWLSTHCDKVAIVAHSQGAAVVDLALRKWASQPGTPDSILLITFGEGIKKLGIIRDMQMESYAPNALPKLLQGRTIGWLSVVALLIFLFGLLFFDLPFLMGFWYKNNVLGVLLVLGGLIIGPYLISWGGALALADKWQYNPELRFKKKLSWKDYYASHDIVPNGGLYYVEDEKNALLRDNHTLTTKVSNYASFIFDHNAYFSNLDEFVSFVACDISMFANLGLHRLNYHDEKLIEQARNRRAKRVFALRITRIAALSMVFVIPFLLGGKLLGLVGNNIFLSIDRTAQQVSTPFADLVKQGHIYIGDVNVGISSIVVTIFVFYQIVYLFWQFWNKGEIEVFFRRSNRRLIWVLAGIFFCVGVVGTESLFFTYLWLVNAVFINPALPLIVTIISISCLTLFFAGGIGSSAADPPVMYIIFENDNEQSLSEKATVLAGSTLKLKAKGAFVSRNINWSNVEPKDIEKVKKENIRNTDFKDITSEVAWSCSNLSIATLDSEGLVTAVSPGMVRIIARLGIITGEILVEVVNSTIYTQRANDYAERGRTEDALAEYAKAFAADPGDSAPYFSRGRLYQDEGQLDKALADYSKAIELNPNFDIYKHRAIVYAELGRHEEAIADYSKAIDLDPNNAEAYFERALLHKGQGQFEQAVADYSSAIILNPIYYYSRARFYAENSRHEEAIADYSRAIDLDPYNTVAYFNRGLSHEALKRDKEAIADYSKAIDLDSSPVFVYFLRRAPIYAKQGRHKEAINDYSEVIKLQPGFSSTYYDRADLYAKQGRYEEAIDDYSMAIELAPESRVFYTGRADLYAKQGRHEKAIADYSRAIELAPESSSAYYNRAEFFEAQGQVDRAIIDYQQAVKLLEQDPTHGLMARMRLDKLRSGLD